MATLDQIKSTDWQIGVTGVGDIAEGLSDIRQCIGIILTTSRGSDPLRLEFGSDIYKYVDRPATLAAPAIASEILRVIGLWEPRVKITKLIYTIKSATIYFEMYVTITVGGSAKKLLFELDTSNQFNVNSDNRAFGRGFSFAFN